MPETSYSRF